MSQIQTYVVLYARFLFLPAIQMITLLSIFWGGAWLWSGAVVYLMLTLIADEILSETEAKLSDDISVFHNFLLYMSAGLMVFEMFMLAWFLGVGDFLYFGYNFAEFVHIDLFLLRESSNLTDTLGLIMSVGFTLAGVAGSIGHELMHRTNSRFDFTIGQIVMSLCLYSAFMFEHVYGHHRNVGFENDPSTAKRGMGLWSYIFRSVTLGNKNAFNFEKARLSKKNKHWLSPSNRVLNGHLFGIIVIAVFITSAGWSGLLGFALTTWIAVGTIETFNYLSHYGLVRSPGTPIEARHSWNSYNGVLSGILLNLSRHSNHHKLAGRHYWQLEKEEEGPIVPMGFSLLAVIAIIPPLFHKCMAPSLEHWDQKLATKEELEIVSKYKT